MSFIPSSIFHPLSYQHDQYSCPSSHPLFSILFLTSMTILGRRLNYALGYSNSDHLSHLQGQVQTPYQVIQEP